MKKNILLIIIPVIVVLFIAIFLFYRFQAEPQEEIVECNQFVGGGFDIIFNTNGGNEISSIHGCIACSPDSYPDLPIPVKENSTFDGWYYDANFQNKVEGTSTLNITPKQSVGKNGCQTGYEDITLYAKWN